MTQLFDTTGYDTPEITERHLRSVPTNGAQSATTGEGSIVRGTQWRLDQETIAVGREGIARARQALQDAAASRTTDDDKQRRAA